MKLLVAVKGGAGSGNWGHSGRPGLVGGSSSGERGTMMGQPSQLEGLIDPDLPKSDKLAIVDALRDVPIEHLQGLTRITTEPPYGYYRDYKGSFTSALDPDHGSIGMYEVGDKSIHVSANHVANRSVLIHELGHHIAFTKSTAGFRLILYQSVVTRLRQTDVDLPALGLRSYSTTNANEFLADAYKVRTFDIAKWHALDSYVQSQLSPVYAREWQKFSSHLQ